MSVLFQNVKNQWNYEKKKYKCRNTGVEVIQVLASSIKLLNVEMLIHENNFHLLLAVTVF